MVPPTLGRYSKVAERETSFPTGSRPVHGRRGSGTTATVDQERGERQDQAAEQAQEDRYEHRVWRLPEPSLHVVGR